tara:strand:- start:2439 stop:3041 length:603 start_codon:yes stop_codon:yes gene_type:complete
VQDTTATVPSPVTVIDSPLEQITETATDNKDQQDSEPQIAREEPIVYIIPTFDKFSGFTVGFSFNQPINSGERYKLGEYAPVIGLSITSPITISAGRFTIGFGLGVESGNDRAGVYGTTNIKLFGKFSLMAGLGSINGSGLHLGAGFDIFVPNIPFSIRPFIRANGRFGKSNVNAPESIYFNTAPFLGWVQTGFVFGYRL